MRLRRRPTPANRWKGAVAGLAGGVVGLLAMQAWFDHVAPAVTRAVPEGDDAGSGDDGDEGALDRVEPIGRHHRDGETSTAALGRHAYRAVSGHEPRSAETRQLLSQLVHWGYGISQGGVYGALRADADGMDLTGGATYGLLLWGLGDELVVPLLGLQDGPTASGAAVHANRAGAHLAWGVATAVATQAVRRVLP